MSRFVSIISFALFITVLPTLSYGQDANVVLKSVVDNRDINSYNEAILFADSLMKVYEKEPFMVSADGGETYWDGLGTIRNVYEQALQFKANDKHAILQLARIYDKLNTRNRNEINDQFNKLVERGDLFFSQKQYVKAAEVYEKALQLKPEDPYCIDKIAEIKTL